MRPYLITAKLMRPSNMKGFPTPVLKYHLNSDNGQLHHNHGATYLQANLLFSHLVPQP
jgi:hypothetical protein